MSKFLSENQLSWFQQIFLERFGVKFIFENNNDHVFLKYERSEKVIIFSNLDKKFYKFGETNLECYDWNAESEGMQGVIEPILKAPSSKPLTPKLIIFNNSGAVVNYDILGLTYWMLNRLEEIDRIDLDSHDRFPAINSHAYKYNYLDRPIVDEWLYILRQVIEKVWPELQLKNNFFSIKVSHDVDVPSLLAFSKPIDVLKTVVLLVLREKNLKLALRAPFIYFSSKNKIHNLDPYNTFDWLMKISEKYKLSSAFYFICGRTDKKLDALYEIDHKIIKDMMLEMHKRGHEIGLHPSYNSFSDPKQIKYEALRLKNICNKIGIIQNEWGGRMHYLRWSHPLTLQAWEDASMDYESTLGYADMPGFRCGTCYEYTGFNPLNKKILNIRIRPLIVMDCTVISERYMGLGYTDKAQKEILNYKKKCKKVKGCFTFLWHNSFFKCKKSFEIYQNIISD